MERKPVHAVFDIGKTNKKLFLFDATGRIVHETSTTFETIEDEDGFPSDDLQRIEVWIRKTMRDCLLSPDWEVSSVNFSGYGASLVFLDETGERIPLFINYLKPFPKDLEREFFNKYGPREDFCNETASPFLGMLNSGLQIYWLKYRKPEYFRRVKYILHFPQYLNYLFSRIPVTEYTSIGCHTGMWNYEKKDYHRWVYEEGITPLLPEVRPSDQWIEKEVEGIPIRIGMGLHDTSASLIPYLKIEKDPFLLLSTGTWSISVNPFSEDALSTEDLEHDCLNLLRIDGGQVRVARLFLGREHEIQTEKLSEVFGVEKERFFNLEWHKDDYESALRKRAYPFDFEHLKPDPPAQNASPADPVWQEAYYQLMDQLVRLQIKAIRRAAGSRVLKKLIIEGGFARNAIFVSLLQRFLPEMEVQVSEIKGGSARGVFELVKE